MALAGNLSESGGGSSGGGSSISGVANDSSHLPTYTNAGAVTTWQFDLNGGLRVTNRVTGVTAQGTDSVALLTATAGWSSAVFTALTNTVVAVKSSAGAVAGYFLYNPNAVVVYVLLYDLATGSVTVGTSTPKAILPLPATSGANILSALGQGYATAISVAASTATGSSSAPSTALVGTIWYA